jgi:hypothetical protein
MRRRRGKVALPAAHFDRAQPSLQGQIAMTRRVGLIENRSSESAKNGAAVDSVFHWNASPVFTNNIKSRARLSAIESPTRTGANSG